MAAGPAPAIPRRLIFLNRYFYPDHSATSQMLSDLAFALAKQGQPVSILTSRLRYDAPAGPLQPHETIGGVDVRRVWTTRFGRINLVGRAVDYATYYLTSAVALWRLARRGDAVIVMTDPPLLSVITGPIARMRSSYSINWLQDIFPEVATASGIATGRVGGLGVALLTRLRDASLKSAAANVVLGDRMADRLQVRGICEAKIHVIPNWADGDAIAPVPAARNELRSAWGLDDAFVVGYSGNLGRVHEFETFLDAIERVEHSAPTSRRIVWLFIGGGSGLTQLQSEVGRRGLTSVQFRPYQPRERLGMSLSAADVHLVSLRQELEGYVVPSKYYGIAAAGRPAIFVGDRDGEIARILERTGSGITIAECDGAGLAAAVTMLASDAAKTGSMGAAARANFDREFSFSEATRRWIALLDRLKTD